MLMVGLGRTNEENEWIAPRSNSQTHLQTRTSEPRIVLLSSCSIIVSMKAVTERFIRALLRCWRCEICSFYQQTKRATAVQK
jgi:hypothetical protein